MSQAPQPQVQPSRSTQMKAATATVVTPDFIASSRKADDGILTRAEKNPVYQIIFGGGDAKETRIAKCKAYLTKGLADGTATVEEMDERRKNLAELNAAIQVLRKQLGSDQAKEITSKAYADFQRIVNETSSDVAIFEGELQPLCQLAELFEKFGANGNIIEKINTAKAQKTARDSRFQAWQDAQSSAAISLQREIRELTNTIANKQAELASAWIGKASLRAAVDDAKSELEQRQQQLVAVQTEKFIDATPDDPDVPPIDESILDLQNIGGEKFKAAITLLRDHTETALAKISVNFDEAVTGLTNARESFIVMDRNCSDATFALSVLEVAVKEAETESRNVAETKIADTGATGALADLDRMEHEQRNDQILTYTASLTTFMKDVGVAVASLRSGQAVIKTILRMNSLALESANTHKITGIANTADAVTITIGSIIEVCNRAASRALADGLTRFRTLAEQGSARLIGGAYEALNQQNEQLGEFVASVENLKTMTQEISANSVEMLRTQFNLVEQMHQQSQQLGEATTDAERTTFSARAGNIAPSATPTQEEAAPVRRFGLKVGG